jgi:hypothetical protein
MFLPELEIAEGRPPQPPLPKKEPQESLQTSTHCPQFKSFAIFGYSPILTYHARRVARALKRKLFRFYHRQVL